VTFQLNFDYYSDQPVQLAVELVNTYDPETGADELADAAALRALLARHDARAMAGEELAVAETDLAGVRTLRGRLREVFTAADERLAVEGLNNLLRRSGAVLCTGGLGPTSDDRTKAAVAEMYDAPLRLDASVLDSLQSFFAARGREMPAINRTQAEVPHGAHVFPNPAGTAPGLALDRAGLGLTIQVLILAVQNTSEHRDLGIATEAWAPLGQGQALDDPVIGRIAEAHGKTPAQAIIRWHLQIDNIVFPKSITPERIEENFDVFDFHLTDAEFEEIEALDAGERIGPDPDTFVRP
jgi:hypothetical protein